MKRLIISSLSLLLLSATTAPVVQAQTTAVVTPTIKNRAYQLQPFNLVNLAYQGQLRQYGIPSYAALIAAYNSGRIDAATLVQQAVKANRVPAPVLADQRYLNAVDRSLQSLSTY